MTYCKNGSLARKAGKINEEEVWRFVDNVASGLAYLHSQRPHIIHQDIKPDNILIDDDGSFLISDFGISRKFLSTQAKMMSTTTASQTSAGTMPYMGPERFSENPMIIMASDIWSFGMTLYELMTGELMWEGMGGCAQLNGAKLPNKVNDLPKLLSLLVKACLEQEPWNRPTAAQIAKFAKTRDLADLNNSKKTINPKPDAKKSEPPKTEPTPTGQTPVTSPTPIRPPVRLTPIHQAPKHPTPKTRTDTWLDKIKKMDTRHLIVLIAGILLLFVFVGGAIYVVLNDMNEKTEFKNCTTYDDFNNFINKYPDSKFINAARNKMRELQPKPLYERPPVPDVPQKVIKKSFTISNNSKEDPNSNNVAQDQLPGRSNKSKRISGNNKNKTKNQDDEKDDVEETLLYDPVTKKLIKITKKK